METQEKENTVKTAYCHLCQTEVETKAGVVENVLHCGQCHALVSGYQAARTSAYDTASTDQQIYC